MTQTPEEKLVELAKAYARHRKALRDNSAAMRKLLDDNPNTDLNLQPYRADYIADERESGGPFADVTWRGWLHAVDTVRGWQDPEEGSMPDEEAPIRKAANLLDERKEINAQGARIRNRLRIIGDQLLRAEP